MSFREHLDADVQDIFLNLDFFAELIELNGVKVKAVRGSSASYPLGMAGGSLPERSVTLYLAEADVPNGVDLHREVTFQRERWAVEGFEPQEGMVKLELVRRGW